MKPRKTQQKPAAKPATHIIDIFTISFFLGVLGVLEYREKKERKIENMLLRRILLDGSMCVFMFYTRGKEKFPANTRKPAFLLQSFGYVAGFVRGFGFFQHPRRLNHA